MPRKANPNRPEYAKIIAEARNQQNLSQFQLGQLIGRDTATIKKYEGGKVLPPFFVLMEISRVLSLDERLLASLVMKEDLSDNWLDAALEEITWIFNLIETDVDFQNKSDIISFSYNAKKISLDKLVFLFEISIILQEARIKYNDFVTSKTNNFVRDLFRDDN